MGAWGSSLPGLCNPALCMNTLVLAASRFLGLKGSLLTALAQTLFASEVGPPWVFLGPLATLWL